LIEKKSKNHIQWRGEGIATEEERIRLSRVREEVSQLRKHELALDEKIRHEQLSIKRISDDPENQQLAFITNEDLATLPSFQGHTLIAIKAPSGTQLEVPDPDEGMPQGQRRYQIFLKSLGDPIDVYLVQSRQSQQLPRVDETQHHSPFPQSYTGAGMLPAPHELPSWPKPCDESSSPQPLRLNTTRSPEHWPPSLPGEPEPYLAVKLSMADPFLPISGIDDSEGISDFFTTEETVATSAFILNEGCAGNGE